MDNFLNRRGSQRGLSLIEVMISLAISSLLTLGLVQMFTSSQNTSKLLNGQATMAESARFGMEMIARSVRKANYRGCNSKREVENEPFNVPYEFDLLNGIQGYESTGSTYDPSFSAMGLPLDGGTGTNEPYTPNGETNTGIDQSELQADSDVLTVWFVDSTEYPVNTPEQTLTNGTEEIVLYESSTSVDTTDESCATGACDAFEVGHVAFINDCATENMFVVSDITATNGFASLAHGTTAFELGLQNRTETLGTSAGYLDNGTMVSRIISHTFFVADSGRTNDFGDAIFSLYRKEGLAAPVELVEGIEDMEVLFGVDTQGELLVPSTYQEANAVGDYRDVVSIRVSLTANSIESVGSSDADGILRRTFTQTVRLRNRLKKE